MLEDNTTVLVTAIIAVCQGLNISFPSKYKKFIPLCAVAVGAVIAFFTHQDYVTAITASLAAVGFHSSVKNTVEIKDKWKGDSNGDQTKVDTKKQH
jgi:hypothetical protein